MAEQITSNQNTTKPLPEKIKFDSGKLSFEQDTLTNTEGASQLLNIPANTLRKWRCTGENNIPFIKIGRQVKYRTSDLRAYIEQHTVNRGV